MATVDLGKISFVNKGTYDASTTYEERDVVQFTDGALSSYVYINATPASGQTPSTGGTVNSSHWNIFAGGVSLAVGNNKIVTSDGSGTITGLSGNNKIITTNNSGVPTAISIGSAGQFLRTNSSANGFEFAAVASDFVKLIEYDITSNVTQFNITGWIDNAYKFYIIRHYIEFANAQDYPTIRFINSSGSANSTSNYDYSMMHPYISGGSANSNTHGTSSASGFRPHSTNSFGTSYSGQCEIHLSHENLSNAEQTHYMFHTVHRENGGQVDIFVGGGMLRDSDAMSGSSAGIQYNRSGSGSFKDGHVVIYGLK